MVTVPPRTERRRARRGSPERPVNGRLYRGTWLLVGLPLLVAAFSVQHPAALPPPSLPPTFDGGSALSLAKELSREYPDRAPGNSGAVGAARWLSDKMTFFGYRPRTNINVDTFTELFDA